MQKKYSTKIKEYKHDDSDSKIFAFLGAFLTIIGYFIVYYTRKNDKYAMYYAKQGLVIFIAWIIAAVAGWIIGFVPVAGDIIETVLWAITLAFWIIGIVYSLSGEEKEIPIIGQFAKKI
jgi:uncharacterized membrane protein